jgi:tRNA 2-thiouridine synthesizing protein B
LLAFLGKQDELVLFQDGVIAAIIDSKHLSSLLGTEAVIYVLEEDIIARGLFSKITRSVEVINYAEFVDITVRHSKQINF